VEVARTFQVVGVPGYEDEATAALYRRGEEGGMEELQGDRQWVHFRGGSAGSDWARGGQGRWVMRRGVRWDRVGAPEISRVSGRVGSGGGGVVKWGRGGWVAGALGRGGAWGRASGRGRGWCEGKDCRGFPAARGSYGAEARGDVAVGSRVRDAVEERGVSKGGWGWGEVGRGERRRGGEVAGSGEVRLGEVVQEAAVWLWWGMVQASV